MSRIHLSLRTRAIALIGLVYLALAGMFVYFTVRAEERAIREEMAAASMGCTRTFGMMIAEPLARGDIASLHAYVEQAAQLAKMSHNQEVEYVILHDLMGKVIASSDREQIGTYPQDALGRRALAASSALIQDRGAVVEVALPIAVGGERRGTLRLGLSLREMQQRLRASKLWGLQIMGVVIVVGMLGAFLVDRQVKRVLGRLIGAARSMAAGDLEQRVEVHTGDDLELLGKTFNEMARKLQDSHEALEQWSRQLEERVRERTAALRRAQARLVQAEKLAATGKLAAGVAHEINTPLASVSAYAEELADCLRELVDGDPPAAEKFFSYLDIIQQQAYRCKEITQGLLNFARKTEFRLEEVRLEDLIGESLRLIAAESRREEVEVVQIPGSGLPLIWTDASKLRQVMANILRNALDAIEGAGRITIATAWQDERAVVRISDTGKGIEAKDMGRIFDPFFTTKEVGRGTGLGLSICYGILEELGGEIEVRSRVNKGTTVRFSIPRTPQRMEAGRGEIGACVDSNPGG